MEKVTSFYKKNIIRRYDELSYIKCFTHADFNGLNKKDISFVSNDGNRLYGGLYYYDGFKPDTLVIFCHGIGGGHLHYMREVERLCREKYLVLAYDNTGSGISEGENIRGLTQSLSDLDSCLGYVESSSELNKKHIFVIGHSWGGYAAGNILNYRKNVEKVVVISGFSSMKALVKGYLKLLYPFFGRSVINFETAANPKYVNSSSVNCFNNQNARALIIHSLDDKMVPYNSGLGFVKKHVKNPNVEYFVTNNKKHNPNYTLDAVNYLNDIFEGFNNGLKNGLYKTNEERITYFEQADWWRMTEQDEEVFAKIFDFLNK